MYLFYLFIIFFNLLLAHWICSPENILLSNSEMQGQQTICGSHLHICNLILWMHFVQNFVLGTCCWPTTCKPFKIKPFTNQTIFCKWFEHNLPQDFKSVSFITDAVKYYLTMAKNLHSWGVRSHVHVSRRAKVLRCVIIVHANKNFWYTFFLYNYLCLVKVFGCITQCLKQHFSSVLFRF